jgi:actin-like protein 6A
MGLHWLITTHGGRRRGREEGGEQKVRCDFLCSPPLENKNLLENKNISSPPPQKKVAAVHEGYLLSKTVTRTAVAGAALTRAMLSVLEQKAGGADKVAPSFSFRRTEVSPGEFKVARLSQPRTTSSFREFHRLSLASDAKEALCRAADAAFDVDANASMPTVTYELPDGTELEVGADRFGVPELLFEPVAGLKRYGVEAGSLASSSSSRPSTAGGSAAAAAGAAAAAAAPAASSSPPLSLPNAVRASIAACDTDLKRDFYANVVLSGGTALLPGLRERLERDLAAHAASQVALAATSKVKVTSPANAVERRFSVWIGGSILASLGSFQQMWMSKAEYEEHGKALIHRRAP